MTAVQRFRDHLPGLLLLGFLSVAGCRMLDSGAAVPPDRMTEVDLPANVAVGDDYDAVLRFKRRELRRVAKHRRRLAEIEAIYKQKVDSMYPDGVPAPKPGDDEDPPVLPPMPGLSREIELEWLSQVRAIDWRYSRIEKAFARYLEINPDDWSAMNDAGEFLYKHGRGQKALACWLQALELAPDEPELHNNVGVYYSHVGEPLKAIDRFREAIRLRADVADYHANLATLYFTARNQVRENEGWDLPTVFWQCQEEYERAFKLDPENFERARNCYENYVMAHFFELGAEDYREKEMAAVDRCLAMELTTRQRVAVLTHKGRLYRKYKELDKAQKVLNEAVELAAGDAPIASHLLHKVRRERMAAKKDRPSGNPNASP